MLGFFDNLCGCFSPELKRNIIQYLSSANLNRTVIQQQKTNEDEEVPKDSIYSQVKTKSYYFMKIQEDEEQHEKELSNPQTNQNVLEPNYYGDQSLDQLYRHKLQCLRQILASEIGPQFSKIYDSQDDLHLKIYCKPEIYQNKRFNSYRFTFRLPHRDHEKATPEDYLNIDLKDKFNLHEPLLIQKQKKSVTEGGLQLYLRKYKKILVINQHQLYTAEKTQKIQENQHNGQVEVYHTTFSVKGEEDKVADCSRGWLNLAGLRVFAVKESEEDGTSLREEEEHLQIEGYINCQLDISVNANMLKQPVAKQIRVYVQKLICSLSKSDAI